MLRVLLLFLALVVLGVFLFVFIAYLLSTYSGSNLDTTSITTTSSVSNLTSNSGPQIFNIKKVYLDSGAPTGDSLNIMLTLPPEAVVTSLSETSLVIETNDGYLFLQNVSEEYVNEFDQKPQVATLDTALGTLYRLPTPDTQVTQYIQSSLGTGELIWYYYVSLYSETGCSQGLDAPQACGSHTVAITNDGNSDLLTAYCGAEEESQIADCEELIKEMQVEILQAN